MAETNPAKTSKSDLKSMGLILLPGIFVLFTQYIWKMSYLFGAMPGIYWLFVLLDAAFGPTLVFSVLAVPVLAILWIGIKNARYKSRVLGTALGIFFLGMGTLCTFPINLAQNTVHLQSIRAGYRMYHLGAYPMFDINFYVAECDPLGIFCRNIFRSGDISDPRWRNSRLNYDPGSGELSLSEPQEGIIFTYFVP